jgi:hypothetical protein
MIRVWNQVQIVFRLISQVRPTVNAYLLQNLGRFDAGESIIADMKFWIFFQKFELY